MSISRTLSRLRHYRHISDSEYFALMQMKKENKQLHKAIEDYKHEITKYIEDECIDENQAQAMMFCMDILDKHIGVK